MKKFLSKLTFMILILCCIYNINTYAATNEAGFAGGSGTENDPYQITTKEQLSNVRNYMSSNFILMNDIVFEESDFKSGGAFYNSGRGWIPLGEGTEEAFTGVFNGNGKEIKGLRINIENRTETQKYVGLFTINDGMIKNLKLTSSKIVVNNKICKDLEVGSIVGGGFGGNIDSCLAICDIEIKDSIQVYEKFYGIYISGLCSGNIHSSLYGGNISVVTDSGDASSKNIIVYAMKGELIKDCINLGNINCKGTYSMNIQGVQGTNILNLGIKSDESNNNGGGLLDSSALSYSIGSEMTVGGHCDSYYYDKNKNIHKATRGTIKKLIETGEWDYSNSWEYIEGFDYPVPKNNPYKNYCKGMNVVDKYVSGLKAEGYSYKSIKLSWPKLEGVDGYVLFRKKEVYIDNYTQSIDDMANNLEKVADLSADILSYIDKSNVEARVNYGYIIIPKYTVNGCTVYGKKNYMPVAKTIDTETNEEKDEVFPWVKYVESLTDISYLPGVVKIKFVVEDDMALDKITVVICPINGGKIYSKTVDAKGKKLYEGLVEIPIPSIAEPNKYIVNSLVVTDSTGNSCPYSVSSLCENSIKVMQEFDIEFTGNLSGKYVANELNNMDEGLTVVLKNDAKSKGILKKELLDAIKGKDKTIVIYSDSAGSIQWVINGRDITGTTKDIDINVELGIKNGNDYGSQGNLQMIKFANNGELPGKINFRLKTEYISSIYNLKNQMYLYYVKGNNVKLENDDCEVIADGAKSWCYMDITHNSTYYLAGQKIKPTISNAKVKLSFSSKVFANKKFTPSVIVKMGSKKLKKNVDYKVAISNNKNVGRAIVTITGKGKYAGKLVKYFQIVPKATSVKKASGTKQGLTVSWKKQATQTSGYEVQYSTNKKFTKSTTKSKLVKKSGTTKLTINNLKSNKKYYVRICTYKNVKIDGKTKRISSAWSKTKTIKVK